MRIVSTTRNHQHLGLIVLAFLAFISLGMPDGLLGVAWPSMRDTFSRPLDSLGILILCMVAGYMVSSFYSGAMIARIGIGKLLAMSCATTGLSLLGYSLVPSWWLLTLCAFTAGLGSGAIDAGINTFVVAHFGKRLMQWLHASWGIGITLGPLIMTAGINLFHSWRWGYVAVGAGQLILAAYFLLTHKKWERISSKASSGEQKKLTDYKTPITKTLLIPRVWLSILLFFFYTGVETVIGVWSYTLLTESRGIQPEIAGLWTGSYWALFTVGRILAGLYTRHITSHALIYASLILALAGAGLLSWNPSELSSLAGVIMVGFSIAPIFPSLVSTTNQRVGDCHAANVIGMQIGAAGFGTAVLPGIAGFAAQRISLEIIPVFLTMMIGALLGFYWLSSTTQPRHQADGQ